MENISLEKKIISTELIECKPTDSSHLPEPLIEYERRVIEDTRATGGCLTIEWIPPENVELISLYSSRRLQKVPSE